MKDKLAPMKTTRKSRLNWKVDIEFDEKGRIIRNKKKDKSNGK